MNQIPTKKKKQRINKEERNVIVTETESKVELCAVIMNVAYYSVHKILIAVCEFTFLFVSNFLFIYFLFSVSTVETCSLLFHSIHFLRIPLNLAVATCDTKQHRVQFSCSFSSTFNWKVSILCVATEKRLCANFAKCTEVFFRISRRAKIYQNFNCEENEFNFNLDWNGFVR